MAQIELRLSNAAFYDAQRIDLVLGQEADASLILHEGEVEWVDHDDQVLDIVQNGHEAHFTAKKVGQGRISIVEKSEADALKVVKVLRVRVVASIELPAVNLGVSAELVEKIESPPIVHPQ